MLPHTGHTKYFVFFIFPPTGPFAPGSPERRVSSSTPRQPESAASSETSGQPLPFSHFETVFGLTESIPASSACVMPCSSRRARIICPAFLQSIFLTSSGSIPYACALRYPRSVESARFSETQSGIPCIRHTAHPRAAAGMGTGHGASRPGSAASPGTRRNTPRIAFRPCPRVR